MDAVNIEIKAKSNNVDEVRDILKKNNARFIGLDHQVDTYFKIPQGRLKLRQGNIENALIFYNRPNQQGPKKSDVKLFRFDQNSELKEILLQSLEVLVEVDKRREIYFINNVKFHIDQVDLLGSFVEIEAIDENGKHAVEELQEQCEYYLKLFGIHESNLLSQSYSDLLMDIS